MKFDKPPLSLTAQLNIRNDTHVDHFGALLVTAFAFATLICI